MPRLRHRNHKGSRWPLIEYGAAACCVAIALLAAPELSIAAYPRQKVASIQHGTGDYFWNYDGDNRDLAASDRDWPITIVFTGTATRAKVRDALQDPDHPLPSTHDPSTPFSKRGRDEYEALKKRNSTRRHTFRSEQGFKNASCGNGKHAGRDTHYRPYALKLGHADAVAGGHPELEGYSAMYDPSVNGYGFFVVASTHFDFGEHGKGPADSACNAPKYWTGESEDAAADIENLIGHTRPDWVVAPDQVDTKNRETGPGQAYRVCKPPPGPIKKCKYRHHRWQNDGKATLINVP